jgi:hypothetical protein
MFTRKIALSIDDFESGRFGQLSQFIQENWPFKNPPTADQSLDILAKSIGYVDVKDARNGATARALSGATGNYAVKTNFTALNYAPKSKAKKKSGDKHLDFLENLLPMNAHDEDSCIFVDQWPLELINRWNFGSENCILSPEFLTTLEDDFASLWCNSLQADNSRSKSMINATSAAIMTSTLYSDLTVAQMGKKTIADLFDDEMANALFQDVMPMLLDDLLSVHEGSAQKLINATGLSVTDLLELPRNESGFPNVYQHMRDYLKHVILPKKINTLFLRSKNKNGFYLDISEMDAGQRKSCKKIELDSGTFFFSLVKDSIDCEIFKTYAWGGQLHDQDGNLNVAVGGTYVVGPPDEQASGGELMSAVDETDSLDVDVIDALLESYQSIILDVHGREVEKVEINTQLIFESANIVTIGYFERASGTQKGLGREVLNSCFDSLQARFKRDMHVAAIMEPYQYKDDATLMPAFDDQCDQDIEKMADAMLQLHTHPYVVGVYTRGRFLA